MREIVHLQIGQSGNQIGTKVRSNNLLLKSSPFGVFEVTTEMKFFTVLGITI